MGVKFDYLKVVAGKGLQFINPFTLKRAGFMNKHKYLTVGGTAAITGAYGVGSRMFKGSSFSGNVSARPQMSYGPGFINWGKRSGMPANHLSTEGLSLGLSKMRHTSTI